MNAEAFNVLKQNRLTVALIYTLDEVKRLPPEKEVFLRYNKYSTMKNKVVDCQYVLDNINDVKIQIENNELLQIVESINSIAGGVVYIKNGFIYGEYVEGNIIMLLRRGICGRRFLIARDNTVYEESAFQNWICAQQRGGGYEWQPFNAAISSVFGFFLNSLKECINKDEDSLLLDVLIEGSRIVFCDAKYKDIDVPMKKLRDVFCDDNGIISLKGGYASQSGLKIDGFDLDNCCCLPESIGIANGAILSHYILYNIRSIENLLYLRFAG
jgi:hypothetical protein